METSINILHGKSRHNIHIVSTYLLFVEKYPILVNRD